VVSSIVSFLPVRAIVRVCVCSVVNRDYLVTLAFQLTCRVCVLTGSDQFTITVDEVSGDHCQCPSGARHEMTGGVVSLTSRVHPSE
jgi:hypothetical protein